MKTAFKDFLVSQFCPNRELAIEMFKLLGHDQDAVLDAKHVFEQWHTYGSLNHPNEDQVIVIAGICRQFLEFEQDRFLEGFFTSEFCLNRELANAVVAAYTGDDFLNYAYEVEFFGCREFPRQFSYNHVASDGKVSEQRVYGPHAVLQVCKWLLCFFHGSVIQLTV